MNREQAKQAAEIMLAYANGEKIEYKVAGHAAWDDTPSLSGPAFNWCNTEYRIKPKKVMIRHALGTEGMVSVLLRGFNTAEDSVTDVWESDTRTIYLDDWHEASFGPQDSSK